MPLFVDWKNGASGTRYTGELPHCLALCSEARPRNAGPRPVGHVLLLDGTAPGFDPAHVSITRRAERFLLPDEVGRITQGGFDELAGSLPPGRLFDGPVVRLAGFAAEAGGWRLDLQPAGYFDYVRSNLMMDWPAPRPGTGTLREAIHGEGRLPAPEASPFADALGISMLLLAAEGSLIVQRRAPTVMVWPGALGPSAAGMAGPEDFEGVATLAGLNPLREAEEELGLPAEVMRGIEPRFLGLTRELARGGTPELFYVARLPLREAELRRLSARATDGDEYTDLLFLPPAEVADPPERLLTEASTPLLAGLALLARNGKPGA